MPAFLLEAAVAVGEAAVSGGELDGGRRGQRERLLKARELGLPEGDVSTLEEAT